MGYSARTPPSIVYNIAFLSFGFLCAALPRASPSSSSALHLWCWLCTSSKLCKLSVGKILVGTSDRHGKMISKMLSAVEEHLVEVMTSGMFSYQTRKLSYGFSVCPAMHCALTLFCNSEQKLIYFEVEIYPYILS
jgi:hypothetical protein